MTVPVETIGHSAEVSPIEDEPEYLGEIPGLVPDGSEASFPADRVLEASGDHVLKDSVGTDTEPVVKPVPVFKAKDFEGHRQILHPRDVHYDAMRSMGRGTVDTIILGNREELKIN